MVGRLAISYDEHIVPLLPFLFLELIQGERERAASASIQSLLAGVNPTPEFGTCNSLLIITNGGIRLTGESEMRSSP